MGRVTSRRPVTRWERGRAVGRPDTLVVEEPLEVRVGGDALTVTMRTPGDDFDLVHGFLLTEALITGPAEVSKLRYCAGTGADDLNTYNVIDVELAAGVALPAVQLRRNFASTSSCGVCGKSSIDAVRTVSRFDPSDDDMRVAPEVLAAMPGTMRAAQGVFDRTGGLHAAAIFAADGSIQALREDIGRHNAVDKVIGAAVRDGLIPLRRQVLLVSGRVSFELVQKAWMAGIPVLAAVSAPSSLAVDLAEEAGMTLVGFLRGETMNVYTGADRVDAPVPG